MTPLVPLWLLVALALALFVACMRALLLERAEGLRPSYPRAIVAGVITAAVAGLAVFATTLRASAPQAPPPKTSSAELIAKKAQLAEVDRQRSALAEEVRVLEGGTGTASLTAAQLEQRRLDQQATAMEIGFLVALIGIGSMLFLGDPRTLLLRGRKRGATREDEPAHPLDAMARAAADGRHEEALRAAATVVQEELEPIDLLDFLFVRAISAIQQANEGKTSMGSRKTLLEQASADLQRLLEEAPNMGEAHYATGTVSFMLGKYAAGAEAFGRAEQLLAGKESLPFANGRSVCLLRQAEALLRDGDAEGATRCFDEVTKLGVLAREIPATLIMHRLAETLADLRAGRLAKAREGIANMRAVKDLDEARKQAAEVTCAIYEILIAHREGAHQAAVDAIAALVAAWLPKDLPELDEQAADEYLFAAVEPDKLKLPAPVFRGLFFLEAISRLLLMTTQPRGPEVDALARPLLRALQFEPRHREVLAALGALYYFCKPEGRDKGLEWLEAAMAMGSKSDSARRWLDLDRTRETTRKTLLDQFATTSARFLSDVMVDPRVKKALLEELGRFHDFRPVLLELERAPDLGHETPTVASLRERAAYIRDVARRMESASDVEVAQTLARARTEYEAALATLETGATRLEEIERRVMEEMGKVVLR